MCESYMAAGLAAQEVWRFLPSSLGLLGLGVSLSGWTGRLCPVVTGPQGQGQFSLLSERKPGPKPL